MPKIGMAILTFSADFEVFVDLPLCEECLYIELLFSVTYNTS